MSTSAAAIWMAVSTNTLAHAITGVWADESHADCSSEARLILQSETAKIGDHLTCAYSGLRQQHATRWYIDLECTDGTIRHLDINWLDRERLMIAERPLGEAVIYSRCGA